MDKFSELKAAAMAATQGPWEWFTSNSMARLSSIPSGKDGDVLSAFRASDGVPCVSVSQHDMAFIATANPAAILALLAELEAKDERIAELEAIRADASQVFKEIGNELGCNPDNESIMMAIDELKAQAKVWESAATKHLARAEEAEKRLATPVRLPNKNDDEFWFDGVFQVAKFDRAVEPAISAAGFKFVGDE
ncbi:TPA: ead/Ea22-like family protein [Pseudomonas aeruginosa]|nr:ead/Ea22-like family protein [Pseudomonas aeruginosa]